MPLTTRTLQISTRQVNGAAVPRSHFRIDLVDPSGEPAFASAAPDGVILSGIEGRTDSSGMASVQLVPSAELEAGLRYRITFQLPDGWRSRRFAMPDQDTRLSAIP